MLVRVFENLEAGGDGLAKMKRLPFSRQPFRSRSADYLFAAGFSSFLTLSFLTLSLVDFVSGFFTSGEAFGLVPFTGLADGAALGVVAGVLAGVEVTGGLVSGAFAFGSQAPNIAVEAAIAAAKTIDLLIALFFPNYRSYSRFFQAAYNP